jgi:hypothetical protein
MLLNPPAPTPFAGQRQRRRRSLPATFALPQRTRRDLVAGEGHRETFSVDLLDSGGVGATSELSVTEGTQLVGLDVARPLGVVFAEQTRLSKPLCVVEEVAAGSNAEKAGVRVGDALRLCTAVLEYRGKVDVVSYYANPPKATMRRALFICDGQPFSKVMRALQSNSEAVELPQGGGMRVFDGIPLVVERAA